MMGVGQQIRRRSKPCRPEPRSPANLLVTVRPMPDIEEASNDVDDQRKNVVDGMGVIVRLLRWRRPVRTRCLQQRLRDRLHRRGRDGEVVADLLRGRRHQQSSSRPRSGFRNVRDRSDACRRRAPQRRRRNEQPNRITANKCGDHRANGAATFRKTSRALHESNLTKGRVERPLFPLYRQSWIGRGGFLKRTRRSVARLMLLSVPLWPTVCLQRLLDFLVMVVTNLGPAANDSHQYSPCLPLASVPMATAIFGFAY